MPINSPDFLLNVADIVRLALAEDLGAGDITARLINPATQVRAQILCKEAAVLCGKRWVDATFNMVDPELQLRWLKAEGASIAIGDSILEISGAARSILTGERTALNFLQTLSGTATVSRHYANLVKHTRVTLLDTRKTLPGLRMAQKYAVRLGGCSNHRLGLFDAFLIKENHIAAAGGIVAAIARARSLGLNKPVEIEVQDLEQLEQAIAGGADSVLLDNFSLDDITAAVALNQSRLRLEASGGINEDTLVKVAETGVDCISIGSLTKHCHAIDFTLLIDSNQPERV
ncbi:MAG: carboxylating nicotinate-nucleotide diphosphorylase [Gammaproteobacteria bacterium]|nr:carboxylating nicotinate-nucleotide diphosphorylase [Gammaproteobacteria bacterium]